jgi:hypothetical protein
VAQLRWVARNLDDLAGVERGQLVADTPIDAGSQTLHES